MNNLNNILVGCMSLMLTILQVQGQPLPNQKHDTLKLDENIRYGILPNGLTYYIKDLKAPHDEISLNFLVKVGSHDELSHEINFAHHIEHLAFRTSRNFPEGLIGNQQLLSEIGMHPHSLGARTNIRSTNFHYNIPTENFLKAFSTGLLWFKDIASGLNLSKKSVDRERGVLLQEQRSDVASFEKNLSENLMYSTLFPCYNNYFENFEYHNRSFPYQDLQQFYKRWYRPDRMAVVVVGNIENVEKVERIIKNNFQDLKASNKIATTARCDFTHSTDLKDFAVIKRSSNINKTVIDNTIETFLFFKDSESLKETERWKTLLREVQLELVTSILNERFKVNSRGYDKDFKNFSSYNTSAEKPPNTLMIFTETVMENEKKSLANTLKLLNQLKKFGITEEELESAKKKKSEEFESSNQENSSYWLREFINHFVYEEVLPNCKNEMLLQWIEKISKNEINKIISQIISPEPQDIGLISPPEENTIWQSEQKIRKFIKNEFSKPTTPYKTPIEIKSLLTPQCLASLPVGPKIGCEKGKLDSRKYILKNGLTLILKQVKSDESNLISIHGFSPYGASCFPAEEYYSTMFAPWIIRNAGIGEFSKFDLESFYRNTVSIKTGASPYINFGEAGIKADVSAEELEKLLQVIYLYFKEPREDPVAFKLWKADLLKNVEYSINPTNDLLDAIREVTEDYSTIPYASTKLKASQQVDMEVAYRNYRMLFADPGSFTFVVTGNFKEEEILPHLQKYLGNIPSSLRIICPEKKEENYINKDPGYYEFGTSEFYKTSNAFYGISFVRKKSEEDDWKEELKIRVLGLILDKLIYELRDKEELSLYQIGAGGKYNRIMNRYEIIFRFSCLPEEFPIVRTKTRNIISDVKNGKISQEVFASQREFLKSVYNPVALNQPSYVAKKLYRNHISKESLISNSEIEQFFKELTFKDIVSTANKYMQEKYMYEVKLE